MGIKGDGSGLVTLITGCMCNTGATHLKDPQAERSYIHKIVFTIFCSPSEIHFFPRKTWCGPSVVWLCVYHVKLWYHLISSSDSHVFSYFTLVKCDTLGILQRSLIAVVNTPPFSILWVVSIFPQLYDMKYKVVLCFPPQKLRLQISPIHFQYMYMQALLCILLGIWNAGMGTECANRWPLWKCESQKNSTKISE